MAVQSVSQRHDFEFKLKIALIYALPYRSSSKNESFPLYQKRSLKTSRTDDTVFGMWRRVTEDGGSTFLRNVIKHLRGYTASHSRL